MFFNFTVLVWGSLDRQEPIVIDLLTFSNTAIGKFTLEDRSFHLWTPPPPSSLSWSGF